MAVKSKDSIGAAIARSIVARREALGLTQAAAARRMGVSRQYWSQIESGQRRLGSVTLVRVAGALETSASALMGRV